MNRGKFIVLEGINASGKSVQRDLLYDRLASDGFPSLKTDEPTYDLPIGKILREVYLPGKRRADNVLMANLYALDRYDQTNHPTMGTKHVIEKGVNVIQSRNYMSSLAIDFTDNNDQYGIDYVNEINKITTTLLKPDVIFVIDVNINNIIDRFTQMNGFKDIFESEEMLRRSYAGYQRAIAYCRDVNKENIVIIDGNRSKEKVAQDIYEYSKKLLTDDN